MTGIKAQGPALSAIMADYDKGPEYAVVECITPGCPATARIPDTGRTSNAVLLQEFQALGWTILPTHCPEHAAPTDQ